jgi:hypothetical protein
MQMVNYTGTPLDERYGVRSALENDGDIVETLRDCYGMVWYLAMEKAKTVYGHEPTREQIMDVIEEAWVNDRVGRERGISGR